MTDYKFIKFLKDKKMVDAYQYYEACSYKLYLAQLSLSALNNVVADYQKKETDVAAEVAGELTFGAAALSVFLHTMSKCVVITGLFTIELFRDFHPFLGGFQIDTVLFTLICIF